LLVERLPLRLFTLIQSMFQFIIRGPRDALSSFNSSEDDRRGGIRFAVQSALLNCCDIRFSSRFNRWLIAGWGGVNINAAAEPWWDLIFSNKFHWEGSCAGLKESGKSSSTRGSRGIVQPSRREASIPTDSVGFDAISDRWSNVIPLLPCEYYANCHPITADGRGSGVRDRLERINEPMPGDWFAGGVAFLAPLCLALTFDDGSGDCLLNIIESSRWGNRGLSFVWRVPIGSSAIMSDASNDSGQENDAVESELEEAITDSKSDSDEDDAFNLDTVKGTSMVEMAQTWSWRLIKTVPLMIVRWINGAAISRGWGQSLEGEGGGHAVEPSQGIVGELLPAGPETRWNAGRGRNRPDRR